MGVIPRQRDMVTDTHIHTTGPAAVVTRVRGVDTFVLRIGFAVQRGMGQSCIGRRDGTLRRDGAGTGLRHSLVVCLPGTTTAGPSPCSAHSTAGCAASTTPTASGTTAGCAPTPRRSDPYRPAVLSPRLPTQTTIVSVATARVSVAATAPPPPSRGHSCSPPPGLSPQEPTDAPNPSPRSTTQSRSVH